MASPTTDHPLRYVLTGELHVRPFPNVKAPQGVAFLAIKQAEDAAACDCDRDADMAHLVALFRHYGAPLPDPQATHSYSPMGRSYLKWEQHTEFVTYTAFSEDLSQRAFDPATLAISFNACLKLRRNRPCRCLALP